MICSFSLNKGSTIESLFGFVTKEDFEQELILEPDDVEAETKPLKPTKVTDEISKPVASQIPVRATRTPAAKPTKEPPKVTSSLTEPPNKKAPLSSNQKVSVVEKRAHDLAADQRKSAQDGLGKHPAKLATQQPAAMRTSQPSSSILENTSPITRTPPRRNLQEGIDLALRRQSLRASKDKLQIAEANCERASDVHRRIGVFRDKPHVKRRGPRQVHRTRLNEEKCHNQFDRLVDALPILRRSIWVMTPPKTRLANFIKKVPNWSEIRDAVEKWLNKQRSNQSARKDNER